MSETECNFVAVIWCQTVQCIEGKQHYFEYDAILPYSIANLNVNNSCHQLLAIGIVDIGTCSTGIVWPKMTVHGTKCNRSF